MNKLLWLCYGTQIIEVVASQRTVLKLSRFVEVVEVETVKTKPLSFRVISDKWLCKWLNVPYETLKSV
jgi:hypothetical protein